jgi:hypothetical protein
MKAGPGPSQAKPSQAKPSLQLTELTPDNTKTNLCPG